MGILSATKRVTLQLSNRCNYATTHALCAAHHFTELEILPTRIIRDVLGVLVEEQYTGGIAFHCYNEPGIDPRLLSLIQEVRSELPESGIHLWTNGWYLDCELLCELREAGVTKFTISAYGESETKRLNEVRLLALKRKRSRIRIGSVLSLDSRMKWIDTPRSGGRRRCYAPLKDLNIRASGRIGLCCYDLFETTTFGNLHEIGFRKAMVAAAAEMDRLGVDLKQRIRKLDVCLGCKRGR